MPRDRRRGGFLWNRQAAKASGRERASPNHLTGALLDTYREPPASIVDGVDVWHQRNPVPFRVISVSSKWTSSPSGRWKWASAALSEL